MAATTAREIASFHLFMVHHLTLCSFALFANRDLLGATTVGRFLKHQKQWDHGKRRDHQQLVIVDVSNDLRLLRDHGIERGAARGGQWIPKLCNGRALERSIHRGNVLPLLVVGRANENPISITFRVERNSAMDRGSLAELTAFVAVADRLSMPIALPFVTRRSGFDGCRWQTFAPPICGEQGGNGRLSGSR
jgi:hypothetical protein